jgi:hypothetical protein
MTLGISIFHSPFMVHTTSKNMDPDDEIRLATNLQFVDQAKPYYKVFSLFWIRIQIF